MKQLKLGLDTTIRDMIVLLKYVHDQYGDDTASIEVFSDLSARLTVNEDDCFSEAEPDNNFTLTAPENTELYTNVEDGF